MRTITGRRVGGRGRRLVVAVVAVLVGAAALAACQPPPPPPPVPVLLVGDSVAKSLETPGTPAYARVGCGITDGVPTVTINPALSAQCAAERDAWFAGVPPADEYLILSTWEIGSFWVGNRVLTFQTPEWDAWLTAQYESLISRLHGRVYLVTVGRHAPVNGVDATPELNALTPAMNDFYNRFAASHPVVRVVDLDAIVCPGGTCPEYIDGVRARPDGGHFSPAGAALIAPRLLAALAAVRNGPPPTLPTTSTTTPPTSTTTVPTSTTTAPPVSTTVPPTSSTTSTTAAP